MPTLQRDFDYLDARDVHGVVYPDDIRNTDRVLARIKKRDAAQDYQEARVWRLSPLGVELVYPEVVSREYEKGESVEVELTIAGQRSVLFGVIVDLVESPEIPRLLGIRLTPMKESLTEENRRTGSRWLCSDRFYPTCMAATPGKFDDYIYFQVRDVSETGLQLMCSLRNKFLISGMRLSLTAVFPMGNVVPIAVEVVRVSVVTIGGRDRLIVGTKFVGLSEQARGALGQYLIQFSSDASAEDLRSSGLAPRSVALGVDFYNLKSEEDYREVLALRHRAHLKDGNIGQHVEVQDMGDINDSRARILVGKYRNKVVATARVRFNEASEPMEHEAFVDWPKELPRRDQIVEISRVATHPEFRRSDLLAALFRITYVNVIQPERPWIVISCLDQMVKFYAKMGFQETGLTHEEPLWEPGKTLNVMIVNTPNIVLGRGVDPLAWNFVWKDVANVLIDSGVVSPTGLDRARLRLYRMIGPVASIFVRRRSPAKSRTR